MAKVKWKIEDKPTAKKLALLVARGVLTTEEARQILIDEVEE